MCAPDSTDRSRRGFLLVAAVVVLLGSFLPVLAPAASAASPAVASAAGTNSAAAALAAAAVVCTSKSHPAVAAALARDIQAARRGRSSTVAVWVDDPGAGITCSLSGSSHFDSASIVKVTILGAVLRKALDQRRYLTSTEATQLRAMITSNSRAYALGLMAQVISSQRWGVPAGAPRSVTIHVKNGWLPRATHGWRINSIGGFKWSKGWYSIMVLSMDNPTMSYGITSVEAIARVIHRDLNPTVKTVIPLSVPNPAWGTPDELIPALPAIP
jgi:hypothetical protein